MPQVGVCLHLCSGEIGPLFIFTISPLLLLLSIVVLTQMGSNLRCPRWFSWQDPVQLHLHDLVGNILWANPPWVIIPQFLDVIVQACELRPVGTLATIVLPFLPDASWFRVYFVRRNRLFRTLMFTLRAQSCTLRLLQTLEPFHTFSDHPALFPS